MNGDVEGRRGTGGARGREGREKGLTRGKMEREKARGERWREREREREREDHGDYLRQTTDISCEGAKETDGRRRGGVY